MRPVSFILKGFTCLMSKSHYKEAEPFTKSTFRIKLYHYKYFDFLVNFDIVSSDVQAVKAENEEQHI